MAQAMIRMMNKIPVMTPATIFAAELREVDSSMRYDIIPKPIKKKFAEISKDKEKNAWK